MIQFLICLFLISEAHKGDAASDAALVKGVKDTLDVCSDIVEAVGDFLSIFETEERRRDSLGVRVVKKLKVCRQLVELVDAFRKNPAKFDPPTSSPTKGVPTSSPTKGVPPTSSPTKVVPRTSSPTSSPTKRVPPMEIGTIGLRSNEVQFLNEQLRSVSKKLGGTLMVASDDGDEASVFHRKCDDQGPTVVVVESTNGAVFGGYTDLTWKGFGYGSSKNTFLFRLRPTTSKLILKPGKGAIYRNPDNGPHFGSYDLYIGSEATDGINSFTSLEHYGKQDTPSNFLNDGLKDFVVKDYVVIEAIKI